MPDKPLHVLVAEALGWTGLDPYQRNDGEIGYYGFPPDGIGRKSGRKSLVPTCDTDAAATVPLMEQFKIGLRWYPTKSRPWEAYLPTDTVGEYGDTILIAVCNLIVRRARSGTLPRP
jgi:hypothetical protein